MIRIGRVCSGGKVHMHTDGRGHGGRGRTHLIEVIPADMLQWIKPEDLCKVCFSAKRLALASSLNAFSESSWDHELDLFLARVGERRAPANGTSPGRLAQMIAELSAMFDRERI